MVEYNKYQEETGKKFMKTSFIFVNRATKVIWIDTSQVLLTSIPKHFANLAFPVCSALR